MFKLTHNDLMALGVILGYESQSSGICHGFACMWAQAILAGEEQLFVQRLQFIASYKPNFQKLKEDIDQARIKVKNSEDLDEIAKKLLEIAAFFDGIELYLSPSSHRDLWENTKIVQTSIPTIYSFVKSKVLDQKDLSLLLEKPYVFDKASLKPYLRALAKILRAAESDLPILLMGSDHTISLRYDRSRKAWCFLDINDLGKFPRNHLYYRKLSLNETVNSIFLALSRGSIQVVFDTMILGNTDALHSPLKDRLLKFDTKFAIKPELATMKQCDGVGLLYLSCNDNYLDIVNKLLKLPNIDVNQGLTDKLTPLAVAAKNGYVEVVKLLVQHPAIEINLTDKFGWSPLHFACQKNKLEVINLLLAQKSKIDINLSTKNGKTALYLAAELGHLAIVKRLLLEKPLIDIHQADNSGYSPFHGACFNGHREVVAEFLKEKQWINQQTKSGETLLSIACEKGWIDIVQDLLQYPMINTALADNKGTTAFHLACRNGHFEIVQSLIPKLSPRYLNLADSLGNTALMDACLAGKTAVVKLLLAQPNINVYSKTLKTGRNLLQIACASPYARDKELFEVLLEKQSRFIFRTLNSSALDLAVKYENEVAILAVLTFAQRKQIPPARIMSPLSLTKLEIWSKKNCPQMLNYLKNTTPSKERFFKAKNVNDLENKKPNLNSQLNKRKREDASVAESGSTDLKPGKHNKLAKTGSDSQQTRHLLITKSRNSSSKKRKSSSLTVKVTHQEEKTAKKQRIILSNRAKNTPTHNSSQWQNIPSMLFTKQQPEEEEVPIVPKMGSC